MELLKSLKEDLMKELSDTDFSQVYEDIDILSCINSYNNLQLKIDDENISKEEKVKLQKEFNKIEKDCLNKNKLTKLNGEEKSYYCLKNEVYDTNGCIIEYDFDAILEDEDLFCEYAGDGIFEFMKKLIIKKIKKMIAENEEY